MPISRIFGISAPAGSFLGLVQPFCAFCTFYHILWFYLSHAYLFVPVLCASESFCFVILFVSVILAESMRLLCNTSYCLRFIIYSLRLWLFIYFCVDITLRVSMDAPAWIARIVNYKDPWQHPVKSDHVMGL